jgi:CheY-like chemotaxis protein
MALKLLLNNFNPFIDEAFNGEQAINKVKVRASDKKYYDYIFMDLTMPIMDGYTATRQLKYMV